MALTTANLRFCPLGGWAAATRLALLEALDRHGTTRALVYHAHFEAFSPIYGNTMLLYFLHHCCLPETTLAQICAGNLERLLEMP